MIELVYNYIFQNKVAKSRQVSISHVQYWPYCEQMHMNSYTGCFMLYMKHAVFEQCIYSGRFDTFPLLTAWMVVCNIIRNGCL